MNKIKLEKGITLIALILTIVVLLIIAVVTIGAVKDDGIIEHAQSAGDSYTVEQEKERIALAYSEYQIEKRLDPSKTLQIEGEDATTEPVGEYGWKVKYEDTGNVYGINSKGEYDEAVTMVIKAVDEVSEIFESFETTNPDLDIDGISLEDFIIYEDQKAISENAAAGSTLYPEKYVFYNWNKLTTDEIRVIETQYEPTPGSEKVENATNRLFILDINGNGIGNASASEIETEEQMIYMGITLGINTEEYIKKVTRYPMEQSKNNHIANICIVGVNETTGNNITIFDKMVEGRNDLIQYYGNFDENVDFYYRKANFLMKFSSYGASNYARAMNNQDATYFSRFHKGLSRFSDLYTKHIYYTSSRPSSI